MSKWIIFGASGFVGRSLTAMLDKRGIVYAAPTSKAIDLAALDAAQKINTLAQDGDSIILLSAYTPDRGDMRGLTLSNIAMMRNLLAGLGGKDIAHFTYVSSDAVYPLTADKVDELTPACPYSLYGQMHAMREQYARDFFPAERLSILRPCAIYGVGDTHFNYGINRFIRSAREQGEITLFGGGEEYRDHVQVDDVASIVLAASEERKAGVFNIASGTSWRFAAIAEHIQKGLGKKVTITHKPRAVPITHRHVAMTKLWSAFPALAPRAIATGITELMRAA